MMFLANASSSEIVKRQYLFKLRAFIGAFIALMLAQWTALGLSILSGSGMTGTSSGNLFIKITYFNGNLLITFTLLWAFTTGITLTTKQTRNGDFAFVTNRLTSHLSSITFLLTAGMIAGITTMLASNLLRVGIAFFSDGNSFLNHSFSVSFLELIMGILATTLYTVLIASIGYLIGMFVQLSKLFVIVIPGLFIALTIGGTNSSLEHIFKFFTNETSLFLFAIKVLTTISIFFATAILISNRLEVRR
ncbi:MAG TPA: hypothetical protein GX497_08355 [Bacillus bacterium]|nr:hypothetical protein [Bacillus sp. (in: firmicutes)]